MTCMRKTKYFMACVEDNLREREAEEFGKGLDSRLVQKVWWEGGI